MAKEEAAFLVDEQLIKLRFDRTLGAQSLGDANEDRLYCLRPMLARDFYVRGFDLPGATNIGVEDGFRPSAKRRSRGGGDDLLGLNWQQRQSDVSDPLNHEPWRKGL